MSRSSTTFREGMSGNVKGRPKGPSAKSKSDKLIRDALMLAIAREVELDGKKFKKLQLMADAMVDSVWQDRNVAAFKEIADRTDGRVPLKMEEGAEFNLLEMVNYSYRLAERRKAADQAKVIEHKPLLEAANVAEKEPGE
jgi:hypothetical protein